MDDFTKKQSDHLDKIADKIDHFQTHNQYFHSLLQKFICSIIPEGKTVIEIGCGLGHLLNLTNSRRGVGVDISSRMTQLAQKRYPHLRFIQTDFKEIFDAEPFDFVLLNNTVNTVEDVGILLETIKTLFHSFTRAIITNFNPLWSGLIRLAAKLGWKTPMPEYNNFLTFLDLQNLLSLHGFEIMAQGFRVFIPVKIPLISNLLNAVIPRLHFLRHLCLVQYYVVRFKQPGSRDHDYSCSVIIPCYNEESNIEACIKRIPPTGTFTEIIVVDDGSKDKTAHIVRALSAQDRRIRLISYSPNQGKGQAVKAGLDIAIGDICMILDADMTVMPEELPKFFHVLQERRAEFANGTRMVYPMENQAMKLLNFLGNKFFGILLSLIMEQRNTDVLCGTKAFFKKDYPAFKLTGYSWWDFELLFAASRLKLKMVEVPIHYKTRKSGESKMRAFRHGWHLIKNCYRGLREIP